MEEKASGKNVFKQFYGLKYVSYGTTGYKFFFCFFFLVNGDVGDCSDFERRR